MIARLWQVEARADFTEYCLQNGSKVVMRRTVKKEAKKAVKGAEKAANKTVKEARKTVQGAKKTVQGQQKNARKTIRYLMAAFGTAR